MEKSDALCSPMEVLSASWLTAMRLHKASCSVCKNQLLLGLDRRPVSALHKRTTQLGRGAEGKIKAVHQGLLAEGHAREPCSDPCGQLGGKPWSPEGSWRGGPIEWGVFSLAVRPDLSV
ncbi:Mlx-Interacting Protein [Manis pentadactyla]|nr:Mlx-Interacting Protein [Manis pentadactyla]